MRFGIKKIDSSSDSSEYFVPVTVTVTQITSQAPLDFMSKDLGNQIR